MGVTEGIYTQKYSYILEATNRKLESRMNFTILLLASLLSVVMGCASQQGRDDENCNGQDGCCHNGKCTEGQGDCDVNSDCKGDLSCGTNNCIGDTFDDNDDCCVDFGKCGASTGGFPGGACRVTWNSCKNGARPVTTFPGPCCCLCVKGAYPLRYDYGKRTC